MCEVFVHSRLEFSCEAIKVHRKYLTMDIVQMGILLKCKDILGLLDKGTEKTSSGIRFWSSLDS